jgi:hypothetical protein
MLLVSDLRVIDIVQFSTTERIVIDIQYLTILKNKTLNTRFSKIEH